MNNKSVILLIALGVLLVTMYLLATRENFGDYVPYSTVHMQGGSVYPPTVLTSTDINSCAPADGVWATPTPGADRSTRLNSPCCQPPDYKIYDPDYKTCDNYAQESDPSIQRCLSDCCKNADAEKNNYDSSWYKMAQCGCALWCYNSKVPHFAKHGTAVHYIEGDIAEVNAPDTPSAESDWRGWIDFGPGGTL